MGIHPTAIIEPGAQVHPSASVGPYSMVETGAVVGEGCIIDSCVRIYGATRMGAHNRVCHGATLGSEPQDLSYSTDKSKPLRIGDHNHFKEGVNISRGVKTDRGTRIGDRNYFMSFSHVGHDCDVGSDNIFANTATLAGHVELAHHVFIAGQVAVHQFCRIGPYTMLGGISGIAQDVPPFVIANGQRARIIGLNSVGLRRNGFSSEQRARIKAVYRILFRSGLRRSEALDRAAADQPGEETDEIIQFIRSSTRGVIGFEPSGARNPV